MMGLHGGALLLAVLLSPVDFPPRSGSAEQKNSIEGSWDCTVLRTKHGEAPYREGVRLDLRRGVMSFGKEAGVYQVRPGAGGEIDLTFQGGAFDGETWRGIYRVRGDTVELFVTRGGLPRPERFGAWPEGDVFNVFLIVLKRQ